MNRNETILPSVLGAIGNTPLVELHRLSKYWDGRVLVKLEYLNPGYSKKDRIALEIIEQALERGDLLPDQPVVELTSGNTGTGLAIVCGVKGIPFVAVMSKGNTPERAKMMRALGAEVVLVDQAPGGTLGHVTGEDLELVEQRAQALVKERGAFRADQFVRPDSALAHERHTAQEILQQTGGEFDAFCDFVGTGGSFGGCATAFKQHRAEIGCYVVEPDGAAAVAGETIRNSNHQIQGGGYCREDLPLIDRKNIDDFLTVTDEEAVLWTRRLAAEEGIFGGFSSGANVAAAAKLLAGDHAGQTIVTLICDSGLKYLSTELWEE